MSGLSTDARLAILDTKTGISIDVYRTWKDLLLAAAYRVCSEEYGKTETLEAVIADVIAQVKKDYYEPSQYTDAETFATKAAFETFIRQWRRGCVGDDADDLTEADFVLELSEDGWPDASEWCAIWCRIKDGGELTAREREQALAYWRTGDGDEVPDQFALNNTGSG